MFFRHKKYATSSSCPPVLSHPILTSAGRDASLVRSSELTSQIQAIWLPPKPSSSPTSRGVSDFKKAAIAGLPGVILIPRILLGLDVLPLELFVGATAFRP